MSARPVFGILSLVFLAGGLLLQFLVILSGAVNSNPENQIYFLQVETSGIQPATRNPSRYTFFAICGVDGDTGRNADCGAVVPALPFDPRRNFGTTTGIPPRFADNHGEFYASRFMFAFYLIALVFGALALITSGLALCTRIGAYMSALNAAGAWFFQALAAALMTAWTVKGRNGFRSAGLEAKLGIKAFAFTWAAMACYFLATVLFCLGGSASKERGYGHTSRFGRKRSTRSRGSLAKEYD